MVIGALMDKKLPISIPLGIRLRIHRGIEVVSGGVKWCQVV
jgi:hypothetical protein